MTPQSRDTHILYRFYNAESELLYVGITNNPGTRFSAHSAQKKWWDEVAEIKLSQFANRQELENAERTAIRDEQPRYNIVCADPRKAAEARVLGSTFSLAEVAAMVLPPEWTDSERWLRRRLNRGQIAGYQVSRGVWRMTEKQLDAFIETFTNAPSEPIAPQPVSTPAATVAEGLSRRSRRRLRSAS